MELSIYQVDAFTDQLFSGNPAAVCPLDSWLDNTVMQSIATENNLSETAFFVPTENGFHIRWFTPNKEVNLCGHATLACAYVIFEQLNYQKESIVFESLSGPLIVKKVDDKIELDFPNQAPIECQAPQALLDAFAEKPIGCYKSKDYILVFDKEEQVIQAKPDFNKLKTLDLRGVCITAASHEYDFVSRCFAPIYGIDEDPVTGSSFTQLAPLWATLLSKSLNKTQFIAKQVSQRGGVVHCELAGDRVKISGQATLYLRGTIYI